MATAPRLDLLRLAGADEARAILFCNDGDTLEPATLTPVLEAFPHAAVLVRAYDRRHLIRLQGVDLAGTVREVYESAICMGRQALGAVGIEPDEITRVEDEYRRRDALRLTEQGRKGDLHAAAHMVFTPERSLDTEERV
jgi:glutathione-regulated potassium-efflux system protein KefB